MNKNVLIGLGALVLILVGGFIFLRQRQSTTLTPELPQLIPQLPTEVPTPPEVFPTVPTETQTSAETPTETPISTPTPTTQEFVVRITNTGFEPSILEVPKGAKVTFVNESSNPSWPASAVHPTHRVYPGSGIEKCGTPEQERIFDACRGLGKGESWSFVFNEVGEWGYHDHLNPSLRGKIIVK